MSSENWIDSKQMAELLGIHRTTLLRTKTTGFLREGVHFTKKNPTAARGDFLWHRHRTLEKFGRSL